MPIFSIYFFFSYMYFDEFIKFKMMTKRFLFFSFSFPNSWKQPNLFVFICQFQKDDIKVYYLVKKIVLLPIHKHDQG